jgi:hypothetical protein
MRKVNTGKPVLDKIRNKQSKHKHAISRMTPSNLVRCDISSEIVVWERNSLLQNNIVIEKV